MRAFFHGTVFDFCLAALSYIKGIVNSYTDRYSLWNEITWLIVFVFFLNILTEYSP